MIEYIKFWLSKEIVALAAPFALLAIMIGTIGCVVMLHKLYYKIRGDHES